MQSELEHQVKAIIANCLAVTDPQFEDDTQLVNELYFDSLELMDLVLGLNEQFGIDIGGDEVVGLITVSDVYREVERQLVLRMATETAPALQQQQECRRESAIEDKVHAICTVWGNSGNERGLQ